MVYYPVPLHKMKVFKGRCECFGKSCENVGAEFIPPENVGEGFTPSRRNVEEGFNPPANKRNVGEGFQPSRNMHTLLFTEEAVEQVLSLPIEPICGEGVYKQVIEEIKSLSTVYPARKVRGR